MVAGTGDCFRSSLGMLVPRRNVILAVLTGNGPGAGRNELRPCTDTCYPGEIIAHRRVVQELRAGRGPRAASPLAAPARAHITSTHEGDPPRSAVGADGSAHGRHRRGAPDN